MILTHAGCGGSVDVTEEGNFAWKCPVCGSLGEFYKATVQRWNPEKDCWEKDSSDFVWLIPPGWSTMSQTEPMPDSVIVRRC